MAAAGKFARAAGRAAGVRCEAVSRPVAPYYPSPLPRTAENLLYEAVAQVTQQSNLKAGLPQLAAEIARLQPARPEFYVELGEAWMNAASRALRRRRSN